MWTEFELRQSGIKRSHGGFFGRHPKAFCFRRKPQITVGRQESGRSGAEGPDQDCGGCCDDGCESGELVDHGKRFGGLNRDISDQINGESDACEPKMNGDESLYGGSWPPPSEGNEERGHVSLTT